MSDGTMNTEVPIDATGKVYHLDCTREDIAPNVILVGDPGRVPKVSGLFDEGSVRFKSSNREIVIHTGTYKGVPVTTLSTGMGTDNTEIVLTELHILYEFNHKERTWAKPATPINLIRCGTCGCPHADVAPGSLAVTQLSIGMDNTGTFYADVPPPDAAMQELVKAIESSPLKSIPPYVTRADPLVTETIQAAAPPAKRRRTVVGHTASASGFYACQGRKVGRLAGLKFPSLPDDLSKLKADGKPVVNIEMETSALCQLSRILGYRAGAVCVVVANRAGGKGSLLPDSDKGPAMTDCLETALGALVQLSKTK
eukprot:Hpha_TRINITY_DN16657_c0_g2::TRINITY_DN16657_c0_g2_i1::g.178436::m.178436/K00757/udp, UPP; uridine phosphorylase